MAIKTIKYSFFLLLLFLASCKNEADVWLQSVNIGQSVWNKDDTLKFELPVSDTSQWYALYINTRNRTDYDFQNLYLFIKTQAPYGGKTIDTLNYMLAYDSGKWTGEGGIFSKFRENTFLYRNNIKFMEPGTYTVSIRHGMRKENLNGIATVGIVLRSYENIKIP